MAAGIALACAWMDMDDYPASYFAPETIHSASAYPFFLSYHFTYYKSDGESFTYVNDNVKNFNQINIEEWNTFLGKIVFRDDIYNILYSSRLGEIDTLIFSIKKPGFPLSNNLKNNSVLKADKRKALDFLYYTGFAKRCEPYVTYVPDIWSYDDKKPNDPRADKASIEKLEAGGIKQVGNASSTFVRQRYMFQVMRLYFMEGNYTQCVNYYNNNQKSFDSLQNSMKYRAMGYAAGAYNKQKQYGSANFIYAQLFAQYQPMKTTAFLSFHPQEEKDWNQTIAMAKTDDEKLAVWQTFGICWDPFRACKELYTLNPKTDALDLMLVRLINTVEQNSLPANMEGTVASGLAKGNAADIAGFVKSVADKGNTNKPYEWDLAAGYIGWLSNVKDYNSYLDKAAKEASADNLVQEQIRLIHLLDKIGQGKAGDKKFENSVADDLNWLSKGKHDSAFRRDYAYNSTLKQLSDKYKKSGSNFLASCFKGELDTADKTNNKFLNDFVAYMSKANSPFEKFALSVFKYTKNDIIALQAVNLMYQYDFKGALAKYKEGDSAGRDSLYGNPFNIRINDCHDCDAAKYGKNRQTKLWFVQKMVDMQDKVNTDPNDAQDLFLLANGFYNMSYFGNNRVLYDTKATYMGEAGFDWGSNERSTATYMSCAKAEEYYNKALAASTDPEFKAKCCFMAAKCEQNAFFCNKPKNYKGDFKAGKYFATLKSTYSNTKYYKEILNECGYFKEFARN